MSDLRPGLIFEIATETGIVLKGKGDKRTCKCPLHDDRTASAFFTEDNRFFCSVCTPDGAIGAKKLCELLGLNWSTYRDRLRDAGPSIKAKRPEPGFTEIEAQRVWRHARATARDDDLVNEHRAAYEYLARRNLIEAIEVGALGVLPKFADAPASIAGWFAGKYRVISPLFDERGHVANVQGRAIEDRDPRTLFPKGSRAAGLVFADARGQALLRGESAGDTVIYGEGLTDNAALAICSPAPVLCAPGTSMAVAGVGAWAKNKRVFIALDCDDAGRAALKPVADALYRAGATRVVRTRWPKPAKDACDVLAKCGTAGLFDFLSCQIGAAVA